MLALLAALIAAGLTAVPTMTTRPCCAGTAEAAARGTAAAASASGLGPSSAVLSSRSLVAVAHSGLTGHGEITISAG